MKTAALSPSLTQRWWSHGYEDGFFELGWCPCQYHIRLHWVHVCWYHRSHLVAEPGLPILLVASPKYTFWTNKMLYIRTCVQNGIQSSCHIYRSMFTIVRDNTLHHFYTFLSSCISDPVLNFSIIRQSHIQRQGFGTSRWAILFVLYRITNLSKVTGKHVGRVA